MAQLVSQMRIPRLLIISHDAIGSRMAGPGIRYWEIARALAAQQPVMLIAPHPIDLQPPAFKCGSYTWGDPTSLEAWLNDADVVLANGVVLQVHPELAQLDRPLAIDLYDPILLENLELYRDAPEGQRDEQQQADAFLLKRQLVAADFFLCATERQRDLYIGALMAAGRITPAVTDRDPELRHLIDVVPFGLPPEPPIKQGPALRGVIPGIGADDALVLWTGGLWDWMDPLTLVEALPRVTTQHPNVRLVFLAGQHPGNTHPMRMPEAAKALAAELGLLDRYVFFYEAWVPYTQRADVLLEADLGVSLHRPHLETRYASIRSRILDHLWAGLPSLVSAGDPASELLGQAGAALVVAPSQRDQVAEALLQLLGDPALRAAQSQAAKELAGAYTWPVVVKPLAAFCRHPRWTRSTVLSSSRQATASPLQQPATGGIDPMLQQRAELLEACRRAALAVQEHTWRLHEPALSSGKLKRLRRFLVQQIVRPFVMPLIEQQQEYNLAVLRSSHLLNEQLREFEEQMHALTERWQALERELHRLHEQSQHVPTLNERMGAAEQHLRMIRQQLYEFTEQLAGLEDADSQLVAALGKVDGVSTATQDEEHR
jgi:glycosyltransferase involved in cell wall biosynthesis